MARGATATWWPFQRAPPRIATPQHQRMRLGPWAGFADGIEDTAKITLDIRLQQDSTTIAATGLIFGAMAYRTIKYPAAEPS